MVICEKANCIGVEIKTSSTIHSPQVAKELFSDLVTDKILLLASQQFSEQELNNCSSTVRLEFKKEFPHQITDEILLLASQQFESKQSSPLYTNSSLDSGLLFEGAINEAVGETSGAANRGSS